MSKIIKVSSDNFQEEVLNFKGVVLVDFYADWCMPCKMLAPSLESLAEDLQDNQAVKIAKVNVDDDQDLAIEYGVQGIPNVIIFKDGQKIEQIVGLRRQEDYKDLILGSLKS